MGNALVNRRATDLAFGVWLSRVPIIYLGLRPVVVNTWWADWITCYSL